MSGEKTEQPTPKKIRDSREKGQVAQSKDITMATAILTIFMTIVFSKRYLVEEYSTCYKQILQVIEKNNTDLSTLIQIVEQVSSSIIGLFTPIFIAALTSVLINIAQLKGLILSKEFLKFDLNKLNPINNFKSIFSMKTVLKFVKQNIEVIIMLCASWIYIRAQITPILKLCYASYLSDIIIYMLSFFVKLFFLLLSIYILAAIIDFMIEARNLTKQLMMSHQEIKEEFKNTEGNMEIKAKRKELHMELMEEESANNMVDKSSLIIANPTHIAILLLYQPTRWQVPLILAKATDNDALRLIKIAKAKNVLVIRDKFLARKIYKECNAGMFINEAILPDIAKIIADNLDRLPKVMAEMRTLNISNSSDNKI